MSGFLILAVLAFGPWQTGTAGEAASWETHFRRGQEALQKGDAPLAAREFKEVLASRPDLVEAQVNLGLAYHLTGDYAQAVEVLESARRANPNLGGANLVLGRDALKLGKPGEAIPPLELAVSGDPADHGRHKLLCDAYTEVEQFQKAAECTAAVYGPDPAEAEGWYYLGKSSLDLAKAATVRMRNRFAADAWGRRLAGDSFAQRGDWPQAAKLYGEAVQKAPALPGFHAALAKALLRLGRTAEAEQAFRRELEIAPGSYEARCGLAGIHGTQSCDAAGRAMQPAGAIETLLAEDQPDHPDPQVTYELVQAFLARADQCFDTLLSRYQDSWLAHKLRAEYDEVRENPAAAAAEYREAIKRHPGDPALHAALADVLFRQGSTPEAAAEVHTALRRSPESPRLLVLAGRISAHEGKVPDAVEFFRAALRREPGLLEAHALLGQTLWRQGDAKGAATELARAASIDTYGNLHYLLFQAYRKLGKTEQANAALARSKQLRNARLRADAQKVDEPEPR
jgi:predicted Zn-dependent protease